MGQKNIYVILTKTNTILSKLISLIKNDEYTHAALSIDRELKNMYSFGRKKVYNPFVGCFVKESFDKGVYGYHKYLHGLVIEIQITDEQYNKVKELLNDFKLNSNLYKYNYLGLINCIFNREYYSNYKFLCSEFVYYILYNIKAVNLNRPRNLVRPQDLLNIKGKIVYKGNLKELISYENFYNNMIQYPNIEYVKI